MLYTLGLVIGALASGLVVWVLAGLLSPVPVPVAAAVVGAAALLGLMRDFKLVNFYLPENRRLVPERVFERGFGRGAFQFGIEMGTGARTYVPSTTPYVLVVALALLSGGFGSIAAASLGFALGRAAVPWIRTLVLHPLEWERRSANASEVVIRIAAVEYVAFALVLTWPI